MDESSITRAMTNQNLAFDSVTPQNIFCPTNRCHTINRHSHRNWNIKHFREEISQQVS